MTGGLDYFDYELRSGLEVVVPWLAERVTLEGKALADFGCHQGGVLEAFRRSTGVASGVGFEFDAVEVARSPFSADSSFRVEQQNILNLDPAQHQFNVIVLRDVLEHVVDVDGVLAIARDCLRPDGVVFVSFPPYFSPLGGHQHISSNWAALTPYLHLLPRRLFFRCLQIEENEYLTKEGSLRDLHAIRDTHLTLRKAERTFAAAAFEVADRDLFLLRPEYEIRYGLPTVRAGLPGRIPGLREVVVMGAHYLLRPSRAP